MEITISLPKKIENALLKKAEASGQDIKTVVEQIIEISVEPPSRATVNPNFERDMLAFADGTEKIPAFTGNYSRGELYSDHD